ncbi:MAG: RagB/SusD family nutrient uptake outer membrane protein [Tannerellaceae bacterium]|nr:RagB/SusD family nutrient uptake outer membrane protein [Tannerellaceae bacterium]
MKKIIWMAATALLCVSCEDFLDTENYTKKDTTNFPLTATDADQMVTGIYATLSMAVSDPHTTYFYAAELASDERFGGGGENDKHFMAMDHLLNVGPNAYSPFWEARYKGVFRANMALATLDNCDVDEVSLNRYKGEAHYLRAFFLHELAEMFGEVPLTVSTEPVNVPRTGIDLIYGQIAYDLKSAIDLLPATKYNVLPSGHATKWAAEALMARIFLFYTGFYGTQELPLGNGEGTENTGSVSKAEVIGWIDDCVANSGHSLIDDFRRLWPYSNPYTAAEYDYVKDLADSGNTWVMDGAGNPEHVFVVKASNLADWGTIIGFSNQYILHFGLRADNGGEDTFPFGVGWGAGPVNSTLWTEWEKAEPNDMRRKASILNVDDECQSFIYGADKQMEETGFWQKKYICIRAHDEGGALKNSFSSLMWTNDDNFQLRQVQDLIVIRFADVLLMQSELKENAGGINSVRARVNLPPVGYSLEALKRERRFELAFEGRRWADIRRWGEAPALLDKQVGVSIYNRGLPDVMKNFGTGYSARYNETKGFFPLPTSQIDLSDGVLEQTAGWGTAAQEFQGW